jgi:glycerophosphoryl diester phosphodiesterase
MRHPFLRDLRPTLHISHRGGALLAPENTLAAFREAVERWRTDMLELDVHPTRDGVLVVSHDGTLERCTNGEGPLSTCTFSELQRLDAGYRFTRDGGRTFPFRGRGLRLPSLQEVLETFPAMRFNVDAKADIPGIELAVASTLRRQRALHRVCLGSEIDGLAERLVRVLPEVCFFYPRDALTELVVAIKTEGPLPDDPRYQVLDIPLDFGEVRLVDRSLVRAAETLNRWVNVWTVDEVETMRALVDLGVGGIMTDRPDLLREVLG